jgi:hypothetical protein
MTNKLSGNDLKERGEDYKHNTPKEMFLVFEKIFVEILKFFHT